MNIDPATLDMLVAPVIIGWDGKEALLHENTALFAYYANGKVDLNEHYFEHRRSEIIGLFGYDGAQKKYLFTAYKPGAQKPDARIIPSNKKQVVTNNTVLAEPGENIQVQNHQRVIIFSLKVPPRSGLM